MYPGLHQRWLEGVFLRADRAFWAVDGRDGATRPSVAGGDAPHLRAGQETLPAPAARRHHAGNALRNAPAITRGLTRIGAEWAAEYGVCGTAESHDAPECVGAGAANDRREDLDAALALVDLAAERLPRLVAGHGVASGRCAGDEHDVAEGVVEARRATSSQRRTSIAGRSSFTVGPP